MEKISVDANIAKTFSASISNEWVRQFLDLNKLSKSTLFEDVLKYFLDHADKHGDWTGFVRTIEAFANSNKYRSVLLWGCESYGYTVKAEKGVIYLKTAKSGAQKTNASLAQYIGSASPEQKGKLSDLIGRKAVKETNDNKPRGGDAFYFRVPGSYGTGKRR